MRSNMLIEGVVAPTFDPIELRSNQAPVNVCGNLFCSSTYPASGPSLEKTTS